MRAAVVEIGRLHANLLLWNVRAKFYHAKKRLSEEGLGQPQPTAASGTNNRAAVRKAVLDVKIQIGVSRPLGVSARVVRHAPRCEPGLRFRIRADNGQLQTNCL